jgi:hypothetical protein
LGRRNLPGVIYPVIRFLSAFVDLFIDLFTTFFGVLGFDTDKNVFFSATSFFSSYHPLVRI